MSTFIQPRHVYAHDEGEGHVYLSAPLVTLMARLKAAGVSEAMVHRDENFAEFADQTTPIEDNLVLVNAVGAPYVERLRNIISRVREGATVVLGGQIVESLGDDFDRLFSTVRSDVRVVNGMRQGVLEEIFKVTAVPSQETVSSIPVWETFDNNKMKSYLQHSMSLYLSQGCKEKCNFCQAKNNRPEVYRDLDEAANDLRWLAEKAQSFGINTLEIYFSNLDLLQKPKELEIFLDKMIEMKRTLNFNFSFTALAQVPSVVAATDALLAKAKEAGLISLGVGVDGATAAAWKATGKVQNLSAPGEDDTGQCIDCIRKLHVNGITPEILMVFGHVLKNMESSVADLEAALPFAKDMMEQFGAIPRPHVVKTIIPGTEGWKKRNTKGELIESLLAHPERFQALDYTALATELSHADPEFRSLVNHYYIRMCELSPRSTKFVYPNTPEYQEYAVQKGSTVEVLNQGMYDR